MKAFLFVFAFAATCVHSSICFAATLQNLIVNGDFEAGNSGFDTGYRNSTTTIPSFEQYAITTDPRLVHNQAASFGDHTTGSGLMMAVNGPESRFDLTVWSQRVDVEPDTIYDLSAWISSWTGGPAAPLEGQALLEFSINDQILGSHRASILPGVWEEFRTTWDSGTEDIADIRIINLTVGRFLLNDFALDDIRLSEQPAPMIGDTDGDCDVDIDDLNNVRNHFGTTGFGDGTLAGDAYPFDGVVDIEDLNLVRNNCCRNIEAAAVPEPSGLLLITAAGFFLCFRKRANQ